MEQEELINLFKRIAYKEPIILTDLVYKALEKEEAREVIKELFKD